MTDKPIDLGFVKIWMDEEGMLHLVYAPGVEVTLKESREAGVALAELSRGRKKPLLTDARLLKNINLHFPVHKKAQFITVLGT